MVMVEDVDVVDSYTSKALVEARKQVLARSEITVGTGSHVPSRLGGDDQFVS